MSRGKNADVGNMKGKSRTYKDIFAAGACVTLLLHTFLWGCASSPGTAENTAAKNEIPGARNPNDELWSLLAKGNIEQAEKLFQGKYHVHDRDSLGRTALHAAAEQGNPDLAEFLIGIGADANALDNAGRTPLGICTVNRDAATARVIARGGANIHYPMPEGSTPALDAIRDAAVPGGGAFLEAILTPKTVVSVDRAGRSLLHLAAAEGNYACLRPVLAFETELDRKDLEGNTPLDLALARGDSRNHAAAAERLILAGAHSELPLYGYFAPAVRSSNYNLRNPDGITPLHYAVAAGYEGYVTFLLEKKAAVNIKIASGATPLHEAARLGRLDLINLLLANGADVNAQDATGNSALHIGIPPETQRGIINALLSQGANPNLKDIRGDSPLHVALMLNRPPDVIQALLAGGADVSIRNIEGKTPLFLTVGMEPVRPLTNSYVSLLIRYKSDIFAVDNAGDTPYETALRKGRPFLPLLITRETVLQNDSGGNTILHVTIRNRGSAETIAQILDARANVNARNKEGDTGLHIAVRRNDAEAGGLLLSRGAEVFSTNARGETPFSLSFPAQGPVREWMLTPATLTAKDGLGNTFLHYAARGQLDRYIDLIVAKGAKTEAANATGETPLFVAVKQNSPSTIKALITAGADLAGRDTLGNSALHAAVNWGALSAAQALLDLGLDINSQALNGKTALHEAVRLEKPDMEQMLLARGASLETRDGGGNTPLLEAVFCALAGTLEYPVRDVEYLLDRGADPAVRTPKGDTGLQLAVASRNSEIAGLFLGVGVSIHTKNSQGLTPYTTALAISPWMTSTLLTKDRLNVPDDEGNTPLHIAVLADASPQVIKTILDMGAKTQSVDAQGKTALRIAVEEGRWETARLLADGGADVFLPAWDGSTPADLALDKGVEGVRALFSGKAVNSRDAAGNTILHYAARKGNFSLVNLLIDLGANKTQRNIAQESPADIALRWEHNDVLALLR